MTTASLEEALESVTDVITTSSMQRKKAYKPKTKSGCKTCRYVPHVCSMIDHWRQRDSY